MEHATSAESLELLNQLLAVWLPRQPGTTIAGGESRNESLCPSRPSQLLPRINYPLCRHDPDRTHTRIYASADHPSRHCPSTSREQLTRLEEEDCYLAEVEVDEVLRLVGDIGAEVTAHNAVPGWVVLLVELLLHISCDVLLDVVLIEGVHCAVNSVLLHLLRHVGILDHGLALR